MQWLKEHSLESFLDFCFSVVLLSTGLYSLHEAFAEGSKVVVIVIVVAIHKHRSNKRVQAALAAAKVAGIKAAGIQSVKAMVGQVNRWTPSR